MRKIVMLFLVLIFADSVTAQNTPNDCVNAIVVCGNGTFSSNASGIGNTQEVSGCGGSEHNSIWLKINIVQSGTLGFDLIPDDPALSVDYDFWVYGPNKSCSSLGSPIRCATTNPLEAGLTSNHTGMNDNPVSQAGPGANGNGYVYRLNVVAGQFYYIAIDRPVGNGGFQIQWTGTATQNGGAFPTPPTANQIPDMKTCSNTPDVGIFDLNSVRSQINPNLVSNTITFYTSLANAIDGLSPLPNIISNDPNPQTIYAKVVDNVSGCYTIIDFKLRVYPVPSANISISDTAVCSGENVTVTFTGTPGATVEYKLNNGAIQTVLLDASGTFQLNQTITVNSTYTLVSAKILDTNNATVCSQTENDTVTVTVSSVNAPTLTTNSPICEGDMAVLTFSGLPNAVITYSVNAGPSTTVTLDASGQKLINLINLPAGSNQINLSNIADANAPNCSQPLNINETIIVNEEITTSILVTPNVCEGSTSSQITFTGIGGTSPYVFVYNINAGPNQTITTTVGNSVTINIPTNVPGAFTYQLVSVASTLTPSCVFPQTGAATVTVNALPSISGTTSVCVGSSTLLSGSGSPAASNPWTSSNTSIASVNSTGIVTGISAGTTVVTYTNTNGCSITTTVTVNPSITPLFTQVAPICSGETLSPLPTTSTNGIIGTWTPALNNTATTTYTFIPTVTGVCATTVTMTITVNPIVTPLFTQVMPICSGGTLSSLPTTSNNGITGTWSPALNNLATTVYTFTPSTGQCAVSATMTITVNSNVTPTFTQVAPICSGATLTALPTTSNNSITGTWSPALNNLATTIYTFTPTTGQCAVSTTMAITVNPNVTPTFTQVAPICSGGTLSPLPTTSNNGITGSWSPAINNTATTTYTFTPTAGLCATTASMTIIVATVTPTFIQVAPICTGSALSALPTTSIEGITGTWSPALNNLATTTYVFTPSVGQCATTASMTIVVNQLVTPIFTQVSPICTGEILAPLPTTSTNGITGTWSPTMNNLTTTLYTFTPTAGQCATTANMTIAVTPKPIITAVNNTPSICSGDQIDITLTCTNLPNAVIYWEYESSPANGGSNGSGTGPIHLTDLLTLQNSISVPTTVTITAYAEEGCKGEEIQINIVINPLPKPLITGGFICIDENDTVISSHTLNTGLSSINHTFVWYYNGNIISGATGSTYVVVEISEVGVYAVEVTNTNTTCTSDRTWATVDASYAAKSATYVVSNYFENNQTITITVNGTGSYLYSLDGSEFQESNTFTYVSPGEHTVTIHDSQGCTDITINNIITIGYPSFFTPNGDGYHDTWNIWSLRNQSNAEIHIFDRYGKLIKQITTKGEGWDGTLNGQDLPSTDYWFTVKYNENQAEKIFKAHFSLKR